MQIKKPNHPGSLCLERTTVSFLTQWKPFSCADKKADLKPYSGMKVIKQEVNVLSWFLMPVAIHVFENSPLLTNALKKTHPTPNRTMSLFIQASVIRKRETNSR